MTVHRDSSDWGLKFLGFDISDTDKPFREISWWSECPLEKTSTVVESEAIIVIFHIVIG